jgi:hypothetical protein
MDLNLSNFSNVTYPVNIQLINVRITFPEIPWNNIITVLVLLVLLVSILKGWIKVERFF